MSEDGVLSRPDGLVLHRDDDVAVLTRHVEAGESVEVAVPGGLIRLQLPGAVAIGHKIALRSMGVGHQVRKYGEVIGALTASVVPGEHIHVHNLVSLRA